MFGAGQRDFCIFFFTRVSSFMKTSKLAITKTLGSLLERKKKQRHPLQPHSQQTENKPVHARQPSTPASHPHSNFPLHNFPPTHSWLDNNWDTGCKNYLQDEKNWIQGESFSKCFCFFHGDRRLPVRIAISLWQSNRSATINLPFLFNHPHHFHFPPPPPHTKKKKNPPTNQHKWQTYINGPPQKKGGRNRECTHCHSKHLWGVVGASRKCDAWQAARDMLDDIRPFRWVK